MKSKMTRYEITFIPSRIDLTIEAESESEAMKKAEEQALEQIDLDSNCTCTEILD